MFCKLSCLASAREGRTRGAGNFDLLLQCLLRGFVVSANLRNSPQKLNRKVSTSWLAKLPMTATAGPGAAAKVPEPRIQEKLGGNPTEPVRTRQESTRHALALLGR